VVEIITIGGGLSDFLGAFCSGRLFSVPGVSMSMSLFLMVAKKLRVGTVFGICLTAVDIKIDLVDTVVVSKVSLKKCILRSLYFLEVVNLGL
jgi:hypothetical protein